MCRVLLVHTRQSQPQVHLGQSEPHATLDYAGVKEVPMAKKRGEVLSILGIEKYGWHVVE